jgi:hypothetical protein
MLCTLTLAILCLSELQKYLTVETKSDMLVDVSHKDDILNINIDIMFPKMPCELITLHAEDIMGHHVTNISGSLFKRKYSKEG